MAARGGDGAARLGEAATHQAGRPAAGGLDWLHEIKFDGYRMPGSTGARSDC
jgi:ATP-dependent DNA ligase